jgi:hypothetical protein
MSYDSFWVLHSKLENEIKNAVEDRRRQLGGCSEHTNAPPVPNGHISTSVRLAIAIRYFAGGSPYDLCSVYGISHSSLHESVWIIVDVVNKHKEFHIVYPLSHASQKKLQVDSKKSQPPTSVYAPVPLMEFLFGLTNYLLLIAKSLGWVKRNSYVVARINSASTARPFAMKEGVSWTFPYAWEEHHPTA